MFAKTAASSIAAGGAVKNSGPFGRAGGGGTLYDRISRAYSSRAASS